LALTRAILQASKVLILDEGMRLPSTPTRSASSNASWLFTATSGLDAPTELHIQKTLFRQFHDTTVIAIMHRLDDITSYDKVLVLHHGKVAAFANPAVILSDDNYAWIRKTEE
jgi:ABC-type multidrug transport system fused ATPase/permease subunit